MNLNEAIASRFDLLVGNNVNLSEYSEWKSVNCPFHSDTNASAGINFSLKLFNCFGCGKKINFKTLAEELEITWSESEVFYTGSSNSDWFTNVIEDTITLPKRTIKTQAKEYAEFLISKQIKPETIEEFGGYYVNDFSHQDYGCLVIPYGKDKFHKRRILETRGEPRFKQDKGLSKSLFGRDFNSHNSIILVEGVTDYFTLWQQSIYNIAATFGAQVSKEQMYLLRDKTVYILFDRDYAGYEGAKKAAEYLKLFNSIPIILEIPERFSTNGENKIDCNSAYIAFGNIFIDWLRSQISKYDIFDSEYISSIFLENKKTVKYISSGIASLDKCLNGGFASGVHIIGGRAEAGKSTLVTYLQNRFVDTGQRVLTLSYELSKEQMWARECSVYSEYSWADLEKDHSLLEDSVAKHIQTISNYLRIDTGWNINEVKAAANNFDVIIVDYIQRMPLDDKEEREGIKFNARALSDIANNGNKIVILISSMPNQGDNFKETGDLKYICQSGYILTKVTKNIAKLEMIKNTRGESRDIYLEMDYAHQKISECIKPDLSELLGA